MDPAMEALMGFSSFSKVSNPTQQPASNLPNRPTGFATGSNGFNPGPGGFSSHQFDGRAGRGQRGHRGGPSGGSSRGGRGAHRGNSHPLGGSADTFAHKRQRMEGHPSNQGHRGAHSGGHHSGPSRGGRGRRGTGGNLGNFQTEGFNKESFFEDPWAKIMKA
ncbi:hypothetical protein [Phaffia rhodozyma]|uniref:Uncharacterized protein n=1 Tax=Phaffia rhodozyma TaxID=264483 RepID=A0A0F7SGR5_PHARH|nr:hypothetical protein [Phaffia rhodozyma]